MRIVVVVLAAALTAACANPAKFAPAVEALSTATKSAQAAMLDADAEASKGVRRALLAYAAANPGAVKWPDRECQQSSLECSVIVEFEGVKYDVTQDQPSAIPKQLKLMAGLVEYTEALQLLATAPDKAALDGASEKVSNAIAKVAALSGPVGAVAVFAVPVGHAVAWVVGEAQDMAKMAALRKATGDMQKAFAEALSDQTKAATLPLLAETVDALYLGRINEARQKFIVDQGAWMRAPSAASLDAYVAAAKALDAALAGRPKPIFAALLDVHGALADALAKGTPPDEKLRDRISDFAERVKRAAAIAREFRDAAKGPKT